MARPFCRVRDPLAGFFALPRAVLERAEALNPIGYKIGLELIVKCGCTRIVELPIHFSDRRFGESKLGLREQVNYLRHLKRLADFKFGAWSQLSQFYIVGASGMGVDLLSYALLLRAGVALPLARALAIFVAIGWNFMLNRRVSFSDARRGRTVVDQYFRWLASTALGAVISWSVAVVLTLFTEFFAEHVFISATLGIVAGSLTNFILARYWVFTNSRQKAKSRSLKEVATAEDLTVSPPTVRNAHPRNQARVRPAPRSGSASIPEHSGGDDAHSPLLEMTPLDVTATARALLSNSKIDNFN